MTLDTKLESIFNVCCYYSLVHTSSFQTNWCLFSLSAAAAAASSGFQAVTCWYLHWLLSVALHRIIQYSYLWGEMKTDICAFLSYKRFCQQELAILTSIFIQDWLYNSDLCHRKTVGIKGLLQELSLFCHFSFLYDKFVTQCGIKATPEPLIFR